MEIKEDVETFDKLLCQMEEDYLLSGSLDDDGMALIDETAEQAAKLMNTAANKSTALLQWFRIQ